MPILILYGVSAVHLWGKIKTGCVCVLSVIEAGKPSSDYGGGLFYLSTKKSGVKDFIALTVLSNKVPSVSGL